MRPARSTQSTKRIMFVEGITDKHVVHHICQRNLEFPDFGIEQQQGVDNLLATMEAQVRVPGREVVAFVLDANDNIANRWQSVRDRLARVEVVLPRRPSLAGTIVPGKPQVGVWLMPDNTSAGELEGFVRTMVPDGDPVWPLAQRYIGSIPEEHRKFKPRKSSRAELYAWIATRRNPGRLGEAIGAKDLDTSGELCVRFSQWVRDLFE